MSQNREMIVDRRKFLKDWMAAAVSVGSFSAAWQSSAKVTGQTPQAESALAVHNMLIIGTQNTYLYHLPMFSFTGFVSPHRYQVILEVSFDADIKDRYLNDAKDNPSARFYTFNPEERFVLTDLKGTRDSITGTIFRNHAEKKDGKAILQDVVARVKVLHFEDLSSQPNKLTRLEYLVFGKPDEIFLAHRLALPPDFDQILSVTIPDGVFSDEALSKIPHLVLPRKNVIIQRLQSNRRSVIGREKGSSIDFKIVATREHYLEEGELKTTPEFATTPIEAAAGFP